MNFIPMLFSGDEVLSLNFRMEVPNLIIRFNIKFLAVGPNFSNS